MEYLLVAEGLTKKYGDKIALDHFDIQIPKSSIYGLLGPNGAGKTTFLRIINQISAADSGKVFINGNLLDKTTIAKVGYMPEERGLYKNMKVGEQALYFAKLKGLSSFEAKKQIKFWFDKLEISDWQNKKLSELSKGMGQKVQFMITVIHKPELLIFDEPFSGFDPVNADLIAKEILELKENGATIIFSTHRMESVEAMCDYIALINKSKKILDGSIEEVRNQFKSGKFKVRLSDFKKETLDAFSKDFALENLNETDKSITFDLLIGQEQSSNSVLQSLMEIGKIVTFDEAIPSMNDIFLQAVKGANTNNNSLIN